MWKFLHCADIHLDSPMRGLERYEGAPAAELRRSTRDALVNLVDLAIEERVRFVALAGDLYDGDWTDHGTGLFLNAQMGRLRDAGIRVYLIRGNHDAESQISRYLTLPDNVHQFRTDSAETIVDEDLGLAVHGQGFPTRAVTADLSEGYPPRLAHHFNLGLLHTCATGRDGHERYAPCTIEGLRAKQYDYWGLGHIHKQEILHRDPPIVFPGNIQGRHAREAGPKGCVVVTVEGGRATKLEPKAVDSIRWEVCRIDAGGVDDLEGLLDAASRTIEARRSAAEGRILALRVDFVGASPAHDVIVCEFDRLQAELRNLVRDVGRGQLWLEKVKDSTVRPRPLARGDGPIGVLLGLLDELSVDEERLRGLLDTEFSDLRRKLPMELRGGDDPLPFEDLSSIRTALADVAPMIVRGLTGGEFDL